MTRTRGLLAHAVGVSLLSGGCYGELPGQEQCYGLMPAVEYRREGPWDEHVARAISAHLFAVRSPMSGCLEDQSQGSYYYYHSPSASTPLSGDLTGSFARVALELSRKSDRDPALEVGVSLGLCSASRFTFTGSLEGAPLREERGSVDVLPLFDDLGGFIRLALGPRTWLRAELYDSEAGGPHWEERSLVVEFRRSGGACVTVGLRKLSIDANDPRSENTLKLQDSIYGLTVGVALIR